jgi:hypothetical protein
VRPRDRRLPTLTLLPGLSRRLTTDELAPAKLDVLPLLTGRLEPASGLPQSLLRRLQLRAVGRIEHQARNVSPETTDLALQPLDISDERLLALIQLAQRVLLSNSHHFPFD